MPMGKVQAVNILEESLKSGDPSSGWSYSRLQYIRTPHSNVPNLIYLSFEGVRVWYESCHLFHTLFDIFSFSYLLI